MSTIETITLPGGYADLAYDFRLTAPEGVSFAGATVTARAARVGSDSVSIAGSATPAAGHVDVVFAANSLSAGVWTMDVTITPVGGSPQRSRIETEIAAALPPV